MIIMGCGDSKYYCLNGCGTVMKGIILISPDKRFAFPLGVFFLPSRYCDILTVIADRGISVEPAFSVIVDGCGHVSVASDFRYPYNLQFLDRERKVVLEVHLCYRYAPSHHNCYRTKEGFTIINQCECSPCKNGSQF